MRRCRAAGAPGAWSVSNVAWRDLRHVRVGPGEGELLEGRDAGAAHAKRSGALAHAGDEAEWSSAIALRVAALGPAAERAVVDRVRVGVARRGGDLGEEPLLDPAVVGVELREPEAVLLAGAEDDVDPLGLAALEASDLLAVEAELEEEVGLGAAGELRVGDLVAPVAEVGRAVVDAEEEVGVAGPAVVEEGAW